MTAHTSWRRRSASVLATATAVLLAASGALMAPAAAFAEEAPAAPQLSISKPVLDPAGDTLTVVGTGFDASAKGLPSYYGCTDSAEAPQGVYVQLGWVTDNWRPSTGGVSKTDRNGVEQAWFADKDKNCQAPSKWTIAEDGTASFEHTFDVSEEKLGALPEGARYAVFTHGLTGRAPALAIPANELEQSFSFAPEVVAPVATAATAVSATKNGLSISVSAKDLPADITDMYAAVIIKGTESQMTDPNSKYAAFGLPFPKVTNGAAEFTLQAPTKDLDRTKQYELFLWKKHADLTPENTYARADVTVTKEQWDTVFPTVAPKIPFTDMKPGDKFYKEISWMYTSKLSTGNKQADGTVTYAPKANVSREAMAAFLFRQYSKPGYKAPAKSAFTDVKTTDKFYKEIAWMAEMKISTGVKQANGTVKFLPKASITREAMAAFMYRIDTGKKPASPKVSPFVDMKPGDKFFKEIAWMHSSGLSTGNKQPSGKPTYAPKSNVTREAMAAFLYRAQP
ncbi:minor extracellular serine protease [Leucobacter sp. 7(1)]|uniref:S-layer homology domain-containing protein n=1 Tax=Leucobacter sp. 7(1) TaxID=1255613 RepID=UPI00097F5DD1|nr:S-layer homology domain-containing protein [Leucobacter sp. 7(1)]SJN08255.1 minor extracellular serine protease [Leucobacter sp. 7(1)]